MNKDLGPENSQVIVAFVGSVNAGKSSVINTLLSQVEVDVGPFPGVTNKVSRHNFGKTLVIVDTPGLYDIDQNVSSKTDQFLNAEADAVVFFINGAQGVTEQDVIAYSGIRKSGLPVIVVCSRIDLIEPNDQVALVVEQAEKTLQAEVIPLSSRNGLGIEDLGGEMLILSAKIKQDRDDFLRINLNSVLRQIDFSVSSNIFYWLAGKFIR